MTLSADEVYKKTSLLYERKQCDGEFVILHSNDVDRIGRSSTCVHQIARIRGREKKDAEYAEDAEDAAVRLRRVPRFEASAVS